MEGFELVHTFKDGEGVQRTQTVLVHQQTRWLLVKQLADTLFGWAYAFVEVRFNEEEKRYVANSQERRFVVVKKSEKVLADAGRTRAGRDVLESVHNEVRILRDVLEPCPHICTVFNFFSDQHFYYTVYPFFNAGELYDYIAQGPNNCLPESEAAPIFRDIVRGVTHLHKHNVVHFDISPENVILHRLPDGSLRAIIIDFGGARIIPPSGVDDFELPFSIGKKLYMSPEMFMVRTTHHVQGKPCDIWTLGTTLFVMLFGVILYKAPEETDVSYSQMVIQGKFMDTLQAWGFNPTETPVDLLKFILNPNALERPTISQIMNHPFVLEITDEMDVDTSETAA